MTLIDMMPNVQSLTRSEKVQLIQVLAEDLAHVEPIAVEANRSFPIWSPYDAYEAADVLMAALATDTNTQK